MLGALKWLNGAIQQDDFLQTVESDVCGDVTVVSPR